MSPDQFTQIKNKIETSAILSERERKEWLFLLPKMSETETKELDRILSVRMPVSIPSPQPLSPSPSTVRGTLSSPGESNKVDGIAHRSFFRHLLEHKEKNQNIESRISNIEKSQGPKTEIPHSTFDIPSSPRRPDIIPARPHPATPGVEVRQELAPLLRLSLEDLRRPPSIYVCLENLHKQIETMVAKKDASVAEILAAFEKSPLYRDYLQSGVKYINHDPNPPLSREEFEALTDFRSSLKKLDTTKY